MKKTTNGALDADRLTALLEEVNDRLRGMEARIHNLEARLADTAKPEAAKQEPARPVAGAPPPAPLPVAAAKEEEPIEPEVLMVIAATVAAFMGKKARIRRVRRSATPGMNPWAQQGRVSIQASHMMR
jgi:methylmalonyl-CoA carboxyltransferase large subunit